MPRSSTWSGTLRPAASTSEAGSLSLRPPASSSGRRTVQKSVRGPPSELKTTTLVPPGREARSAM